MFETLRARVGLAAAFFIPRGLSAATVLVASALSAQTVLFPTPIHLTRQIGDPISHSSSIVDEYYQGNRAFAIRGTLTAITDYEKGQLTRIDRAAGTYSITTFEAIASRTKGEFPAVVSRQGSKLTTRSAGNRVIAGRNTQLIEASREDRAVSRRFQIALDPEITVSDAALEVIVGSAYPNPKNEDSQDLIAAMRSAAPAGAMSKAGSSTALPLEQTITYDIDGESLRFTNVVSRVGNELPPADLVTIPPGARRVDDERLQLPQILHDLDSLNPRPTPRK